MAANQLGDISLENSGQQQATNVGHVSTVPNYIIETSFFWTV